MGYVRDFIGGMDPTGTATYANAMAEKDKTARHAAAGIAGGVTSGTILGASVPAAGYALLSLAARKKSPALSRAFKESAESAIGALNPKNLVKSIKNLKGSAEHVADKNKVKDIAEKYINEAHATGKVSISKEDMSHISKVKELEQRMKNTHGIEDPETHSRKMLGHAMGIIGAASGATVSGISAGKQYANAASDKAKEVENKKIFDDLRRSSGINKAAMLSKLSDLITDSMKRQDDVSKYRQGLAMQAAGALPILGSLAVPANTTLGTVGKLGLIAGGASINSTGNTKALSAIANAIDNKGGVESKSEFKRRLRHSSPEDYKKYTSGQTQSLIGNVAGLGGVLGEVQAKNKYIKAVSGLGALAGATGSILGKKKSNEALYDAISKNQG